MGPSLLAGASGIRAARGHNTRPSGEQTSLSPTFRSRYCSQKATMLLQVGAEVLLAAAVPSGILVEHGYSSIPSCPRTIHEPSSQILHCSRTVWKWLLVLWCNQCPHGRNTTSSSPPTSRVPSCWPQLGSRTASAARSSRGPRGRSTRASSQETSLAPSSGSPRRSRTRPAAGRQASPPWSLRR